MQSQSDSADSGERYFEDRVIDNGVILFSLMVTRLMLKKHRAIFPPKIWGRLMQRLVMLEKRYKNPEYSGVSFDDGNQ